MTMSIVNRSLPITPASRPTFITISTTNARIHGRSHGKGRAPRIAGDERAGDSAEHLAGDGDHQHDEQRREPGTATNADAVVLRPARGKSTGNLTPAGASCP